MNRRLTHRLSYITLLTGVLMAVSACQYTEQMEAEKEASALQQIEQVDQRFSQRLEAIESIPANERPELATLIDNVNSYNTMGIQKVLAQYEGNDTNQIVNVAPKSQIVENGAMLLGVRDYNKALQSVRNRASELGGQVVSEDEYSNDSIVENTIVLLLPPNDFTTFVQEMRDMATPLRQKKLWRDDQTTQYIDLEARLASKKASQESLAALLKTANTAGDIATIQKELDEVTTELESLVRSAQALTEKVTYSTLTITIYQELELPDPVTADFGERFTGGLSSGWINFKEFLIDAANVWPYAVIGLIFLLTIWLAMRSSRKQARQFRMQALQAQQQWLIQQQKFVNNPNQNATSPTAQRPTRASTLAKNSNTNKAPTSAPDYKNIKKP